MVRFTRLLSLHAGRRLLTCVVALMLTTQAASAQEVVKSRFRFGAFERTLTGLDLPSGAAIAADGSILIADAGAHRIVVFSREGQLVRSFGSLGEGDGQLRSPTGLALDSKGLVHVVDSGNDRIVIFTQAGEFVRAWGRRGRDRGEFCEPRNICIAGDRIAIADTGNQRVQVFDARGSYLFQVGVQPGEKQDLFKRPVDVALDADGAMYVVDADRAMVQAFDKGGLSIRSFGDYGPFIGLLNEPMGVSVAGGEILIADSANHRVQFFNDRGEADLQWGIHDPASHEGNGRIHYPYDLAIGGSDDVPFAVICEPLEHRCQIFRGRLPGEPEQPRQANPGSDMTHFGSRITIDGRLLLIPEPEHHYIYVLDMAKELPVMISQSGTRGVKFGQFLRPTGLLVNERERSVAVVDPSLARLQTFALAFQPDEPPKFDPFFARFVQAIDFTHPRFSHPAQGMKWPLVPETLRRDVQGNWHVLDSRNAMVSVFDAKFAFVRAYGGYGSESGRMRQPTDLAFSPDGSVVYVVDAGNFRVQAFDASGTAVRSIGAFGDGDGQFRRPFGITVDDAGAVYVSDALNDCVQKFAATGEFIGKWGTRGAGDGEMWRPMGLAIDARKRLIVIDHGNHRAQMFSLDGEWLGMFSAGRAVLKRNLED